MISSNMNVFSLDMKDIWFYVKTDIDSDIYQQQDTRGDLRITRITYSSIPPLVCYSISKVKFSQRNLCCQYGNVRHLYAVIV